MNTNTNTRKRTRPEAVPPIGASLLGHVASSLGRIGSTWRTSRLVRGRVSGACAAFSRTGRVDTRVAKTRPSRAWSQAWAETCPRTFGRAEVGQIIPGRTDACRTSARSRVRTEAPLARPESRSRCSKRAHRVQSWNRQCRGSFRIGPLHFARAAPRHVVDTRRHEIRWPKNVDATTVPREHISTHWACPGHLPKHLPKLRSGGTPDCIRLIPCRLRRR